MSFLQNPPTYEGAQLGTERDAARLSIFQNPAKDRFAGNPGSTPELRSTGALPCFGVRLLHRFDDLDAQFTKLVGIHVGVLLLRLPD